ncbi:MAG TPA: hypothetical protein VGN26_04820 [Armatimonadota bacterium]|jgi:hypothetical protein
MAEASAPSADRGLDPRGRLHIPIGIANTVDTLKTFVEAEGGFSPGLGTFGVSFWLWDAGTAGLSAPTQEGVTCEHGLAPGGLLVPWAEWQVDGLQVRTEVCQVTRSTRGGRVYLVGARSAVTSLGDRPRRARLFAALRALGPAGGPVERLKVAPGGDAVVVGGQPVLGVRPSALGGWGHWRGYRGPVRPAGAGSGCHRGGCRGWGLLGSPGPRPGAISGGFRDAGIRLSGAGRKACRGAPMGWSQRVGNLPPALHSEESGALALPSGTRRVRLRYRWQ